MGPFCGELLGTLLTLGAAPPTGAENVPLRPQTALALLMSGTGGDLRKTFNIGHDIEEQVARIAGIFTDLAGPDGDFRLRRIH